MDSSSTVILERVSPNGNISAIVERDERTVYFYLFGPQEVVAKLRSCWVRNLAHAPDDVDRGGMMERGAPPMLPASCCSHPLGAPPPAPDNLDVVWFEEGDAAALLEGEQILAVIPAWSGTNGFDGYARDCIAESPICWPLGPPETNVIHARIARAREYWQSWDANPWPAFADAQIAAYRTVLGPYENYYAIDGGAWPPKALLRFDGNDAVTFATVGVGLRPMPRVEMSAEDPSPIRRIELAIAVDPQLLDEPKGRTLGAYISGQSSLPWNRCTWLGEGHTLPCDSLPTGASGNSFTAVLFTRTPPAAPRITLPSYRDDLVTPLWMLPITQRERELIMAKGAALFLDRFAAAGHSWIHKDRAEIPA